MPRRKQPRPPAYCEECGALIQPKAGYPAKTCSETCRKLRNAARERDRYARVKDTEVWTAVRGRYTEQLKEHAARDPEFALHRLAAQREAVARWRAKLQADPQRLAAYREKQRQWWQDLEPERLDEKRARQRAWYASLTREEKILHYYESRRRNALARLQALGGELKRVERQGGQGAGDDDAGTA